MLIPVGIAAGKEVRQLSKKKLNNEAKVVQCYNTKMYKLGMYVAQ